MTACHGCLQLIHINWHWRCLTEVKSPHRKLKEKPLDMLVRKADILETRDTFQSWLPKCRECQEYWIWKSDGRRARSLIWNWPGKRVESVDQKNASPTTIENLNEPSGRIFWIDGQDARSIGKSLSAVRQQIRAPIRCLCMTMIQGRSTAYNLSHGSYNAMQNHVTVGIQICKA